MILYLFLKELFYMERMLSLPLFRAINFQKLINVLRASVNSLFWGLSNCTIHAIVGFRHVYHNYVM